MKFFTIWRLLSFVRPGSVSAFTAFEASAGFEVDGGGVLILDTTSWFLGRLPGARVGPCASSCSVASVGSAGCLFRSRIMLLNATESCFAVKSHQEDNHCFMDLEVDTEQLNNIKY